MLEQCVRVDKIWLQNASVLQANVRVTTTHDNSSCKIAKLSYIFNLKFNGRLDHQPSKVRKYIYAEAEN